MLGFLRKKMKRLRPVQILTLGFLVSILLGALLLRLPFATIENGSAITFLDALFTATSAVCVTGLTVVNVGVTFTLFGKIVIMLLIQVGGLGFMTVASLLFMAIGKRISLRERLLLQESFNTDSLQGMVRLVRSAVLVTLVVEGGAAVLFFIRLLILGYPVGESVFHAAFLSVSAFCNAGFDAFGFQNSIEPFMTDPFICLPIMALITIGGLGFSVILDILHNRRFGRLTLHSRMVLVVSGSLFLIGTLLTALLEWNNAETLAKPGVGPAEKILASAFQSVTLRTAGFDTIGQGDTTPAMQLVSIILMFIGASPASTGGGIKTTTCFLVILSVLAIIRQRQDYNYRQRRLGEGLIKKALAITILALSLVLVDTVVISAIEYWSGGHESLVDILFEVVSAFGTVGLSTGITPSLHAVAKGMIILTMFCGRVGLLTVSMALSGGPDKACAIRYPEDRVMVG